MSQDTLPSPRTLMATAGEIGNCAASVSKDIDGVMCCKADGAADRTEGPVPTAIEPQDVDAGHPCQTSPTNVTAYVWLYTWPVSP